MEYAQLLSLLQGLRPGVDFEKEEGLIDRKILTSFDIVALIGALDDEDRGGVTHEPHHADLHRPEGRQVRARGCHLHGKRVTSVRDGAPRHGRGLTLGDRRLWKARAQVGRRGAPADGAEDLGKRRLRQLWCRLRCACATGAHQGEGEQPHGASSGCGHGDAFSKAGA